MHGNSHKYLPVIEKTDMMIPGSWSACKALANSIPQDHNLVNSTLFLTSSFIANVITTSLALTILTRTCKFQIT